MLHNARRSGHEAAGLAAAGREPFRAVVARLTRSWIDWIARYLDGPEDHRRAEAMTAIALIDGLLLLRQIGGPAQAARAAAQLGVQ